MVNKHEISVEPAPEQGGYRISYSATSSQRSKKSRRKFVYVVSSSSEEKKGLIDEGLLRGVVKKVLDEKPDSVIWRKKPSEIRMEVVHLINRVMKSSKRGKYLSDLGFGDKRGGEKEEVGEAGEGDGEETNPKQYEDPPLPRKSMFAAEKESANTKVFLAPSFSGKTSLMVSQLNQLTTKELDEYDKIVLFTESTASAPLKKLNPKIRNKMMIFDRFLPQFVKLLKKVNTVTNNRYRFLLLLDDCLSLKGDILVKMILTLRNSNISTLISIQYSKLLSKSQRQSIHDYFILNLKLEDFEYLMSGFLASHFRNFFEKEGIASREEINKMNYKKLAERAMVRLKDKILHFDQRHDEISIYNRK